MGAGRASSLVWTSVRIGEAANTLASIPFRCLTSVPGSHLRSNVACSRSGLFEESQEPVAPRSPFHLFLHKVDVHLPNMGVTQRAFFFHPTLCSPSSPLGAAVESRGHQKSLSMRAHPLAVPKRDSWQLRRQTAWCLTRLHTGLCEASWV